MARRLNHQLPNLRLPARLAATSVLGLGFLVFVSVWFSSVLMTGWGFALENFLELGTTLEQIRTISLKWFFVMFGMHALSIPLILAVAQVLADNAGMVTEYLVGKDKLFGALMGEAMRALKGKGNPQLVKDVLARQLAAMK